REFRPLRLQVGAAAIFFVYQGADGIARFQQLVNDNAAGLPGGASHDDSGLDHDRLLLKVVASCSSTPKVVTAALLGSMPSAASKVRPACTGDPSSVLSRAAVFHKGPCLVHGLRVDQEDDAFAIATRIPLADFPIEVELHSCPNLFRYDGHDLLRSYALLG